MYAVPIRRRGGLVLDEKACAGWQTYRQRYPQRAAWLLQKLSVILQHPVCKSQFPEAVCDYVTAGMLVEQRLEGKRWFVPFAGKLEGRFHVWLYDGDAGLHIDFTAHQFRVSAERLRSCAVQVFVLSTPALAAYSYQLPSAPRRLGLLMIADAEQTYAAERL
jgi:hypothetical protein